MTVQVLLEQLQESSGILVVDDPEVDLEHRTPRKNSLRAFPDVAGLEPADCTGRLSRDPPSPSYSATQRRGDPSLPARTLAGPLRPCRRRSRRHYQPSASPRSRQ